MTISRTLTGGRGRQGLVVAPSSATRARWSLVEPCSNSGWPSWPKRFPRTRGHRALLDGAGTGSGLKSWNCGKKERTASTTGSATRLSSESGGSSGYHRDNLAEPHASRSFVRRVGELDERRHHSAPSGSPGDLPSVRETVHMAITGVTTRFGVARVGSSVNQSRSSVNRRRHQPRSDPQVPS